MAADGSAVDAARMAAERDALVGKIAAGLAHDLNGPIGIVLGFNDLSRELLASSGDGLAKEQVVKISEYLDLVDGAAKRARTLTQEIWEFARSVPGETAEVDVQAQLELAARLAAPALRNSGIETPSARQDSIQEQGQAAPADGVKALADPALCSQAFVGLMLEAPSALPSGGQIDWDIDVATDAGAVGVALRAHTWEGAPGEAWAVPRQCAQAIEMAGGRMEPSSQTGQVVLTLQGHR